MDNFSQTDRDRILSLIGSIVIASQSAELLMKSFLPHLKSNANPASKRTTTNQKRTLGDLAGALSSSLSGDYHLLAQLKEELSRVVDERNQVTHHFFQKYQSHLSLGHTSAVIDSLQSILHNTESFASAMEAIHASVHQAVLSRDNGLTGEAEILIFSRDELAS